MFGAKLFGKATKTLGFFGIVTMDVRLGACQCAEDTTRADIAYGAVAVQGDVGIDGPSIGVDTSDIEFTGAGWLVLYGIEGFGRWLVRRCHGQR